MSITGAHWEELHSFLLSLGISAPPTSSPEFRASSLHFLELLLRKNESVNLTAVRDLESAFWKHLADSLALLAWEPLGPMVDWGSGGGVPGLPLAIARKVSGQSDRILILDSVGKKVRAIEEFVSGLGLENVRCFTGRGELLLQEPSFSGVRTVVMRAVAPAERAVHWVHPRVPNWIFFLGPSQREGWLRELPRLQRKHKLVTEEKSFRLPKENGDRVLFRISFRST